MDKYQKQVQLELLEHEEANKKKLVHNYKEALKEIEEKLHNMMDNPDFQGEKTARTKWNRMLEAQLKDILNRLGENNVSDMKGYLDAVYREAYLGCLFGIHQDGVGLVLQVDEDKVGRSLNRTAKELKFSQRLYENADKLKEDVKEEMARGFSTGRDYISIARQISLRGGISLGRACTIARTEGHRVTEESRMDCMRAAASKGAGILKQWDSTLDDKTRGTHRELDGQLREVEEPFEIPSSGRKAMHPGGFGIAKEDINCRCAMATRARWALGDEEYKYSRFSGDIISTESKEYKQWKEEYKRKSSEKDRYLLNDADKRALYDYMGFKSYALNEALRNGRELTPEQKKMAAALDAALDKLPEYKGSLSRSLDFRDETELKSFVESMNVGDTRKFEQYVSCTYGDTYNPNGNVQIFINDAAMGKDISTYNNSEKEVIYKRGIQFTIVNAKIQDGVYYFLLEEIAE